MSDITRLFPASMIPPHRHWPSCCHQTPCLSVVLTMLTDQSTLAVSTRHEKGNNVRTAEASFNKIDDLVCSRSQQAIMLPCRRSAVASQLQDQGAKCRSAASIKPVTVHKTLLNALRQRTTTLDCLCRASSRGAAAAAVAPAAASRTGCWSSRPSTFHSVRSVAATSAAVDASAPPPAAAYQPPQPHKLVMEVAGQKVCQVVQAYCSMHAASVWHQDSFTVINKEDTHSEIFAAATNLPGRCRAGAAESHLPMDALLSELSS